ncbi:MAG TPA: helix-turn-helix transcriptional regulator [Xanthomonadaceae bacterium]|nr:helix-turn-helix transcriptional regulator [Xanthomonadaceae bacterium]
MLAFRATSPPADLAGVVALYWTMCAPPSGVPGPPILPDGCCELIVHLGAPLRRVGSTDAQQPRAFLFGQIERAIRLADTGPSEVFAVRFTPSGVAEWLRQDMYELGGREHALDDLLGRARAFPLHAIEDAADFDARCRIMDAWLRRWRPAHPSPDSTLAALVTSRLRSGPLRVETLARELGVGRRRLERVFARTVGLPVAQFGRLLRIEEAAREIAVGQRRLVDIAMDAGFADHAHFTKRFHEVVGMTPSRYRLEAAVVDGPSGS